MNMRLKEIKMRVTDDEYNQIMQRKTKPRLAEWLRDVALNQQEVKQFSADPKLLTALARIGGNINQIARACNTNQVDKYQAINILLELDIISNQLNKLIEQDYDC